MSYTFETGPIRPPSEAYSILLRVTRNCTWNKCAFCHSYRGTVFSRRSREEVKGDVDSLYALCRRIEEAVGNGVGRFDEEMIRRARGLDDTPEEYYRQAAFWVYHGLRTAFLQDANSLVLKTTDLVEILRYFREKFPTLERITTYARAKTVSRKSPDELRDLREAGLTRLHMGMESGSDRVLELIRKGVTAEEILLSGRRSVEAGFDVSEYYMPGLGGRERWKENAEESARVLNGINPAYIRLRSTVPVPGTALAEMMERGEWIPLTEEEKVREIRLFLENLQGIESRVMSDHMMNLLEDVEGELPRDRDRMLGIIDAFLGMEQEDRENFIIGRRLGVYRFLADYDGGTSVGDARRQIMSRFSSVDEAILEILKNYI